MATYNLNNYSPLITKKDLGEEIYQQIRDMLKVNDQIDVEMGQIVSMTTFCAKQIFGRLYVELGREEYKRRVHLINPSEDVYFIIRIGVTNAVRESKE